MAEAFREGDKHVFGDVEYEVKDVVKAAGAPFITVIFEEVPPIVLPRKHGAIVADVNNIYFGFVRIQNSPYAEANDKPWIQIGSAKRFTTEELKATLQRNGGVKVLYDGEAVSQ